MATQAAIRQRIYDYLYGAFPTESPFVTRLNASYTTGTSITVLENDQFEINDIVENLSTGEQMLVVAKGASEAMTVIRGWNGTTHPNTVGSTDALTKNPRFTQSKVNTPIATTLADLERWQIHVFGTGSITRADPKHFDGIADTALIDPLGVLKI
jgi:hypothetical protein